MVGNLAYLSYYCEGLIILDISDITRPKKIGQLQLKGPFSGKFAGPHPHLPAPARPQLPGGHQRGRALPLLQQRDSHHRPRKGPAMNNLHMIDISDPTDPQLVAEFPYPEVPENYPWPNFNTAGMDGPGPLRPPQHPRAHEQQALAGPEPQPGLLLLLPRGHAGV